MISNQNDPTGESDVTIEDLPTDDSGELIEEEIEDEESSDIADELPNIPGVVQDIQELFDKGCLVTVSNALKPLSVSISPSLFELKGSGGTGTVKYIQRFRVELFSDENTARKMDKLRKGVTELVKLFSFSFGVCENGCK